MARIGLVACAKTKKNKLCAAALLYDSPLFKKSLLYGLSHADRVYILSAKHGMLDLDAKIEPYELTLKKLSNNEKNNWAVRTAEALGKLVTKKDTVIFLAGREYYSGLLPFLSRIGCRVEFPLGNLSLGQRLNALVKMNKQDELFQLVKRFYSTIKELYAAQHGGRRLSECTGKMEWPSRGVYFFFDESEEAVLGGRRLGIPRITRVGTHAVSAGSQTSLWDRLSTHRGTTQGSGSHRSSIFRLHLGRALVNHDSTLTPVASWGVGQSADRQVREVEVTIEREVSIRLGSMKVLWLNIGDVPLPSSDRAFIERNSIGLLSRQNVLSREISETWLGNYSDNYRISLSGLWNLNHLFLEPHEAFAEILQQYVKATIDGASTESSLAPQTWHG